MCRLFGVISSSEVDPGYFLERASRSLLYQSRVRRKERQKDGWGIGWFEKGRPHILKSPKPIYIDLAARRALLDIRSHCLVGHVRQASNPLKLPKHRLIGIENSQPFAYQRWLFAHNGTLLIPKEVRARLGTLDKHIQGNNDSEVLFYWLMKYLREPLTHGKIAGIVSSIRRSLKGIDEIWKMCRNKYPLFKYPYHGLNWVLTDGKILVAMCYVNPGGFGKAKALCDRSEPYYQLHYRRDPNGWTVASETLDDDPRWKRMHHGDVLIADTKRGSFLKCS